MHFLIDADLPRSVGDVLRRYGQQVTDVRDIGMRSASDATLLVYSSIAMSLDGGYKP